jgi:membrane associated rhomboid family serine protease
VSEPDLFVVCKNCSSEVSPYVTECPYCGQRVRKRAPKIERNQGVEEETKRRRRPIRLSPLRRNEIPGIATESRPYATGVLILISLGVTVLIATNRFNAVDLGAITALNHEWWRIVTAPFVYTHAAYEFVALVAIGIFGMLFERRFGPAATVTVFLVSGAAGGALAIALQSYPVYGGNSAALGLLAAWVVDDFLARRRGDDRENDLIGVGVFAAVLLLLPLADTTANPFAGIGGAAAGAVCGALLSPFRP